MKNIIELKKSLMETYDAIVPGYARSRRRPFKIISKIPLEEQRLICDLGCGHGINATFIAEKGCEVVCIDLSTRMLSATRRRSIRRGVYTRVNVIQADMEHPPLRENSLNAAIIIASLHHLPVENAITTLRELGRSLKSRGLVLIVVWAAPQFRFLKAITINILKKILGRVDNVCDVHVSWRSKGRVYARYYHLYTLRSLRDIIEKAGYSIRQIGGLKITSRILYDNYFALAEKR